MTDRPDRSPSDEERALWLAQARAADAEAERERASARREMAEAAMAEAKAEAATIELERERRKRRKELAGDEYEHIYRFVGSVSDSSVKACMDMLQSWSRLDPGCGITLIFQSPGGEIISGMALYDFLAGLRSSGHRLTTVARGYAASMAGILLQAGDVRIMGPEAWLLIHEASFGAIGSFGDVVDTVEWVKRIQERILDIFASRSKLTKRQIKRRWHRKDWWISSDEAFKLGLIDDIG